MKMLRANRGGVGRSSKFRFVQKIHGNFPNRGTPTQTPNILCVLIMGPPKRYP